MGLYSPFNPSPFGSGYQSMPPIGGQPGGSGFSWGGLINSPLAPAIVQLLGGIIGGIGQGREAGAQREEQRRQFDTNAALQQKQFDADEEQRRRHNASLDATAPMRAAIMQAMAQRLGVNMPAQGTPAPSRGGDPTFKPPAILNPNPPQQSGYTPEQQQTIEQLKARGSVSGDQLQAIRGRLHQLFG